AAARPRWRGRRSRPRSAAPRGPAPAASGRARRDRSTGCAVVPRLANERLEQPQVLPGLRMPEHAEREAARGILKRLDRAVVGPRRLAQPVPEPAEALMVMRLHRRVLAQQPAELRLGIERHAVLCELARPRGRAPVHTPRRESARGPGSLAAPRGGGGRVQARPTGPGTPLAGAATVPLRIAPDARSRSWCP